MYLIAGLGNPETRYNATRHNVGFGVIDELSDMYDIDVRTGRFRALIGKGSIEGSQVILMKPLTYMNNSGEAIRPADDYFRIDTGKELIVISDYTELDVGRIRVRPKGTSGGHNGLKSVIAHVGHEDFVRIRVGVGKKPPGADQVNWVLGHFDKEDIPLMKESLRRAAEAAVCVMREGVDAAMNRFNAAVNV